MSARQPSIQTGCPPAPSVFLESANPAMRRAIDTARQVAASDVAVLLVGESGTGKNVLASAIHTWSPQKNGPFVVVSCMTLDQLFPATESFRHATDKSGRLRAAVGGTLFLDEVGDMRLDLQGKLLSLLGEAPFDRAVGGDASSAGMRLVTATRENLQTEVRAGRFREDLFFRLNVVTITLPPLRERREDLTALTEHILIRLAVRHGRRMLRITPEVRGIFEGYRWPGNVRELANTLERAVVLSRGDAITPEHLPDQLLAPLAPTNDGAPLTALSLEDLERQQIGRVLDEAETLEEAATRLGIHPSTLWRKRKRYGFV
jgi:NtrC-family two-component system response regulator AlgB